MTILYEGDKLVRSVTGSKQVQPDGVYRWSDYAIAHECDGIRCLYNNFTKRSYRLDDETFSLNRDKRFSAEEINADKTLRQLVADQFLVLEDKDEVEVYESFCKIARLMRRKYNCYNSFTILPTTACNARCIYCYEQGIEYVTMTDETVRQTIDFIKKIRNPEKPVQFTWFGGEPLVGEKMIDAICAAMREADIEFNSSMVSNGSLITSDILQKMKNDWNLLRIQITLDGTEDEYNRRKNYYFNYDSAYWHVLSRIKLINENGIRLNIRVNVDAGNIDTVPQMAEDLKNFIVDPSLLTFDLAPLFDLQASENGKAIWDKSFQIAQQMIADGFKIITHYSVTRTRIRFCMADSPYQSLVIAPDGKLYNCENIMSFDPIGDIWSGVTNTDYVKKLEEVEHAREMCRGCFSLPQCTTFSRCGHPKVDCKYAAQKRLERALDRMIRYFKDNPNPIEEDSDEGELPDKDC